MASALTIRKDGDLDFLSLGALVHRLDPGIIPFRKATECQIHVSGGEFNVAANSPIASSMKTAIASAMVGLPDWRSDRRARARHGRAAPSTAFPARWRDWTEYGRRLQRPRFWRARAGGFLQPLQRGCRAAEAWGFRLEGDFCRGVRWVHSGGIFAALSPTTAQLAAEMMKAAKDAGAVTSFDLNFREKLWKVSGGDERAVETIARIVENVDVLVGNEEDLQKGLGIAGPKVEVEGEIEARSCGLLRHDRQGRQEASAGKSRSDDAARGAFDESA